MKGSALSKAARESNAQISRSQVGPIVHLRVSGTIDETFSAKAVSEGLSGHVILDLGRLERISSFGVRHWMEFTRSLPAGCEEMLLIHAPLVIVDQLAMVEGFAGVAKILSVLAPYYCDKCGEDRVRLIDARADAAAIAADRAPAQQCQICGSNLRFNDDPLQFFAFLKNQNLGEIDASVDRYLSSQRQLDTGTPANFLKLVEGDITFIRLTGALREDLNVRRLTSGLQGRVCFDFANVGNVEPKGVQKLVEALNAASKDATVFLWRVPASILKLLGGQKLASNIGIASLWLSCECRNCGQRLPQRIDTQQQATAVVLGEALETMCPVCGSPARTAELEGLEGLMPLVACDRAPLGELDTLEPRALSQSLRLGRKDTEHTPSKTDVALAASSSAPKLQVLRRLGHGGMAEVFLARQVGLKGFEKYVVLKRILPQFAGSQQFIDMLFAEARSSARLTHPNIVQVFDVGEMQGSAYITMEHVAGPDLRRLMVLLGRQHTLLPIEHSLRIVSEIACGLHYAHSYVDPTGVPHPVIHRDVSPHNILISLDGAIKLSDFGIAKAMGENEHTAPGIIKGKLSYLPPEAVRSEAVDNRGDVFSLGAVLFELLTARAPFKRDGDVATLHAIASAPVPNPLELNPSLDPRLVPLLMKALEKRPEDRFQSAGAFRQEIENTMAAIGLRSAPDQVAGFIREKLGDQVTQYTSANAASSPAPPGGSGMTPGASPLPQSGSKPGGAATPQPQPSAGGATGQRSPSSSGWAAVAASSALSGTAPGGTRPPSPPPPAAAPAPVAPPPFHDGGHSGSGSISLEFENVPASMEEDSTRTVAPRFDTEPAGPQAAPSGLMQYAAAPQPAMAYPAPAPFPMPQTSPAMASSPYLQAPPGPGPVPGSRPNIPVPWTTGTSSAALPVPQQAPGPIPQIADSPETGPGLVTTVKKSTRWFLIGTVGGILVMAAVIGLRASTGPVEVKNLGPADRVYVAGVRVEPTKIPRTGQAVIAIARDGILYRFGAFSRWGSIDAEALQMAHTSPGETASLWVASDPKGCAVTLDGAHAPSTTPISLKIKAGQETLVEVMCPGLPRRTQWVMGAPGQEIQVSVRMFDDTP